MLALGLIALAGTSAGAANLDLSAYRCAGAGMLEADYTPGPNPPATLGYEWSLSADGACAASPNGPWLFHATGGGYNGTCGSAPAVTDTAEVPYSPFLVAFTMTNPRTGVSRGVGAAWMFTTAASATGALHPFFVRRAVFVPSCDIAQIGRGSGAGALVRLIDPLATATSQQHVATAVAFALQFDD